MKVRVDSCAMASAPAGNELFEAVRETVSAVGPHAYHGPHALRHAFVDCPRNRGLIAGEECVHCAHLLNAVPAADGRSVRVRCLFLESDLVSDLMLGPVDIGTVELDETTATAAARMLEDDVEHLIVTSSGEAVGLISSSALEKVPDAGDEQVATHVVPLPVVPRTMSLGAVTRALRANQLECVAVIDGEELVGLITRTDLRRAGVPDI